MERWAQVARLPSPVAQDLPAPQAKPAGTTDRRSGTRRAACHRQKEAPMKAFTERLENGLITSIGAALFLLLMAALTLR